MGNLSDPSEVQASLMDSKRSRRTLWGSGWSGTTATLCFTMAALLATLCVWASLAGDASQLIRTDAGGRIGGRFSQTGAKAIDILCSAILAPLIVTGLNYVWFTSARRHAVNDIHSNRRGVPLQSLVAVSTSDSGSYNIFAMKTMIGGRTFRLGLLALLVLVAALAKTALSNIIAYEAFTEVQQDQQRLPLRQLADPYIKNTTRYMVYQRLQDERLGLTAAQRAKMVGEIAQLLTDIDYQGSDGKLETDGTYVGTNLTRTAMTNIPKHVMSLSNVPGYQIAVECHADQSAQNLSFVEMSAYKTTITLSLDQKLFMGSYPGQLAELQTAYNEQYAFAAFTLNASDVFLGWTTSFNLTDKVIPSPYGEIRPVAMNASLYGFTGTKIIMSHWGVFCSLHRQEGLLNFTRGAPDSDNGGWVLNESVFQGPKTKVPSFLSQWQLLYRTPDSGLAGVGPALSGAVFSPTENSIERDTNYLLLAHNFLYASAEIERIMYEVLATRDDDQLGPDKGRYFHETTCSVAEEYYRITYVPALLLLGMATLLLATAIAAGMAVFSLRSERTRAVHQVHPLRLLVDFASALHRVEGDDEVGDVKSMKTIAALSDKELDAWAAKYRIMYQRAENDDNVQLELIRVDGLSSTPRLD